MQLLRAYLGDENLFLKNDLSITQVSKSLSNISTTDEELNSHEMNENNPSSMKYAPLYELFSFQGLRTVERVLSTSTEQIKEIFKNRLSTEDISLIKYNMAQKSCAPFSRLSDFQDHQEYFGHIISTGIEGLDYLLEGGLYTEEITEFTGSTSSGKTQCCLTVLATLLLSTNTARAIFIDTVNGFYSKRLRDILNERMKSSKLSLEMKEEMICKYLARVTVLQVFCPLSLARCLANISQYEQKISHEKKGPFRLLIIDSITAVFSQCIGGKYNVLSYSCMSQIVRMIRLLAIQSGAAVLLTNSTVLDYGKTYSTVKPALGLKWSSVADMRIELSRWEVPHDYQEISKKISARLTKSCKSACSFSNISPLQLEINMKGMV